MTTARRNAETPEKTTSIREKKTKYKKKKKKKKPLRRDKKSHDRRDLLYSKDQKILNQWSNMRHDEQSLFTGDKTKYEAKLR